ncbi:major facilitator superfamily domain-containing protein [Microdochium trichocladiopsis]|uniref:Major facilitator superfamily domain-containing protein n=1 Tax=Microdochium trichocladiopsis TaxID=1682393 RepID=A0A9P8XYG6_9PEZI|nr:major facilitator superfamily domain-containing protein [Microdochium trichocladiopsis]KAH7024875.1 major facilitator superfamily domain-containing protein [Microdochium trichocladiopsis]
MPALNDKSPGTSSESEAAPTGIISSDEQDEEKGEQSTEKNGAVESDPARPFSVFSDVQKWFIVLIVASTTMIAPLSSSIFYPVIPLLADELGVSITNINLTITIYLIIQGIAPSFVGNLSDVKGRRPALLISLVIFVAGCVGAALKADYGVLFAMRCLQSVGCSGTIALSLATVSDIVTSAERGKYTSYVQLGWMLGPSLGPVVGGLLSRYLNWQAIFWFLAIYAGVVWLVALLFLPETSRQIVGNGSIPPRAWNKTGLALVRQLVGAAHIRTTGQAATDEKEQQQQPLQPASGGARAALNPLLSLRLFADKETSLLLVYSGLIYASTYMVLSTLSDQLEQVYGLDTLHVSLCFLAPGFGTVISVLLTGRVLDWNFRRHARRAGLAISRQKQQDLAGFPVERARLQSAVAALCLAGVSLVAYGWSLQKHAPLAVPLVFLALQAFGGASAFSGFNNLIMDLNRDRPGVASAAMNMTRCWLGAAGTAFSSPLVSAAGGGGVGWLGVVIPGIWLLFSPFVFAVLRYGPGWREERRLK